MQQNVDVGQALLAMGDGDCSYIYLGDAIIWRVLQFHSHIIDFMTAYNEKKVGLETLITKCTIAQKANKQLKEVYAVPKQHFQLLLLNHQATLPQWKQSAYEVISPLLFGNDSLKKLVHLPNLIALLQNWERAGRLLQQIDYLHGEGRLQACVYTIIPRLHAAMDSSTFHRTLQIMNDQLHFHLDGPLVNRLPELLTVSRP